MNTPKSITSGLNNIKTNVSSGLNNIGNNVSSGLNNIGNNVSSGLNNMGNNVSSGFNNMTSEINQFGNTVSSGMNMPNNLSNNTTNSFFSFWNILKYIFIILIFAFLALNIYTFYKKNYSINKINENENENENENINVNENDIDNIDDIVKPNNENEDEDEDENENENEDENKNEDENINENEDEDMLKQHNLYNVNLDKITKNISKNRLKSDDDGPIPDDSTSKMQTNTMTNKAGYCYIGEDRGFRTCIKIDKGQKCMSGDIFPSQEICINPNLRE